jgi:hypothetical protein
MIDDPELLNFLQSEQARATDNTLNEKRVTANEFYDGAPFGDEVDGRSKLITRDVAEVVDYMTVSILRTLVSGDKIVEFEPLQQGQDEMAQQATERVHWNFLREQDGYAILHDFVKAGLIEKTGVVKSWSEKRFTEQRDIRNAAQIDAEGSDVVRVIGPIEGEYDLDEMSGEALQVYEVAVRAPQQPKFLDAAIPNEEFFVSPDARTLDTAPYVGDESRQSLADLMAMGYSEEDVSTLWGDTSDGKQLADARDNARGYKDSDGIRSGLHRVVTLREEYVFWLFEGIYQRVRVHRVNNSILSVEPVDGQPYTIWSPFPKQHRLVGDSLADKTMDIQVVRSHMLRQGMDGLYIANAPRLYIDMSQADETTIDDALDVAPGGLVRGKGPNAVTPMQQSFTAAPAFTAMEVMAGEKESRTGITRLNQGLDADTLNKTATGTALMQAQGQQIEEYIARNAANAIGEMFEKKLRLMIAEMQPHAFKIDGEFKQVDPSQWPADMRLGVRVGLGSGNKDRRLQALDRLQTAQSEAYALDPRMVTPEKAFSTAKTLTATLGLGTATQYFNDPATFEQQPEQPDPAAMEAQAKAQAQQMEMQMRQQEAGLKLQLQREESQARLELDRQKAQAEIELSRERMQAEMQLKREQMFMQASVNATMPEQRPGGSLAQ